MAKANQEMEQFPDQRVSWCCGAAVDPIPAEEVPHELRDAKPVDAPCGKVRFEVGERLRIGGVHHEEAVEVAGQEERRGLPVVLLVQRRERHALGVPHGDGMIVDLGAIVALGESVGPWP